MGENFPTKILRQFSDNLKFRGRGNCLPCPSPFPSWQDVIDWIGRGDEWRFVRRASNMSSRLRLWHRTGDVTEPWRYTHRIWLTECTTVCPSDACPSACLSVYQCGCCCYSSCCWHSCDVTRTCRPHVIALASARSRLAPSHTCEGAKK